MNSGEIGQEKLNARELTKEIDHATDLAAGELSESKARELGQNVLTNANLDMSGVQTPEQNLRGLEMSQNLNREAAGSLGNRVLTYNPEQAAKIVADNERVQAMAEIDNGYGEAVKSGNESLVGVESKIQTKERLQEDREMIQTEEGQNGPYARNIMERNNKRLTKDTVNNVNKLIADNNYYPGKLDELMTRSRTNFLKDVFNRILGSRN